MSEKSYATNRTTGTLTSSVTLEPHPQNIPHIFRIVPSINDIYYYINIYFISLLIKYEGGIPLLIRHKSLILSSMLCRYRPVLCNKRMVVGGYILVAFVIHQVLVCPLLLLELLNWTQ